MTQCAWPRNVGLSLSRAWFSGAGEDRDVGLKTCLPGFTLSGGVKCGADADFVPVGSLPVCSRSCGVPPVVSKASRSAAEVLFQGNVTYTCDRGYIILDSDKGVHAHCLFDGSFSQFGVVCLPRPCGAPPLALSFRVPFRYCCGVWTSVTYTCDLGYAINPKDVSSTISQLSYKETVSSQCA